MSNVDFTSYDESDKTTLDLHDNGIEDLVDIPNIIQVDRELFARKGGFSEFAKAAWHLVEPSTELKWGWALDAVCEHLEAVHYGQIKNLLINIPPGCMKSFLVGVMFQAWEWGPGGMPHLRFLTTSHKESLAIRDNIRCRDIVNSKWYQDRWGIKLRNDVNATKKYVNNFTGSREAMSFTSLTGSRGDRVIIDDPLSVDDALSETLLEATATTFETAVPTRVNDPKKSSIIVIMQRLHENDPAGIIIRNDDDKYNDYDKLILPMRYESSRPCTTSIGFKDPRTTDGEILFPERFDEDEVVKLEKRLGSYATAGQLQQRPSPLGGGILKGRWFQRYTVLPKMRYRIMTIDTAQKEKQRNDYQVAQCWGLGYDGNIYLIDQLRAKFQGYELESKIPDFWTKHKNVLDQGSLRFMTIEDKVSGTMLIQTLRRKASPKIPIKELKRSTSKLQRVMDVQGYIEAGYVYIPQSAAWVHDFIKECEQFTNDDSHPHDDQVDCLVDAVEYLLANRRLTYGEVMSHR